MIKVLELFGGLGACSKAFERLNIEHEVVDYVEIDKYAVASYNAIHGTNFEPQDITTWNKEIEVDLIMHGSPCQDFSVAGRGAGGDEGSGTRSSLMYETLRIVEQLQPKYVIWENVKNLISKKHRHNFDAYLEQMDRLGYNSHYQVLNAKDYGIPQNRERVFTISIRKGLPNTFEFPEKKPLVKKLKDFLEEEVEEKYYLSNRQLTGMSKTKFNSYRLDNCLRDKNGEAKTITARFEGCPQLVEQPFIAASRGRGEDNHQELEPRKDGNTNTITTVQKDNLVVLPGAYGRKFGSKGKIEDIDGTSSTLQAAMGCGGGNVPLVTPNHRIRKLTPKECWRLMGFDDVDVDKAAKVNSNAQLYKQAGNSIVVNVLEEILKNLL